MTVAGAQREAATLIHLIADWERAHGTIAGVGSFGTLMDHERELLHKLSDWGIEHAARRIDEVIN